MHAQQGRRFTSFACFFLGSIVMIPERYLCSFVKFGIPRYSLLYSFVRAMSLLLLLPGASYFVIC